MIPIYYQMLSYNLGIVNMPPTYILFFCQQGFPDKIINQCIYGLFSIHSVSDINCSNVLAISYLKVLMCRSILHHV